MADYCPFEIYCGVIRSGNINLRDDDFFNGLENACREHQREGLECFTGNRACALIPSNWEKYNIGERERYWLSIATEPLGDL